MRFKCKTSQNKWNKNKIFKLNISWLNVLWAILHCSYMPLGWPTPVVWPSWSLALAKPAGHTLSSIKIFQTWSLYTDSYQIFHGVWMKGCSSVWFDPLLCRESSLTNCSWDREDQHYVYKVQDVLGEKTNQDIYLCVLDRKTDTVQS